jgi:hypothetical protein
VIPTASGIFFLRGFIALTCSRLGLFSPIHNHLTELLNVLQSGWFISQSVARSTGFDRRGSHFVRAKLIEISGGSDLTVQTLGEAGASDRRRQAGKLLSARHFRWA